MDKRYTRYIENLRRVRALVRPETHAGMKAADLLEEIKQNAAESYTLMQQSNAILDEVIFSRRAENLTEEEAAGLPSSRASCSTTPTARTAALPIRSTPCCWITPA